MKPTETTYTELQEAYDHFNRTLFASMLPECLITLQRNKGTAGYFCSDRFADKSGEKTDEIALNPSYFAVVPLVEIMQTVVHEMCHLWQHHFGTPGRARYHNREWADKMLEIGLVPSSTGQPGGKQTGDSMADYPAPNGKFLQACELLLTRKFRITWYDRYPPQVAVHHSAESDAETDMPGLSLELELIAADQGVDVAQPSENKSNRSKYTCPCGYNVWGKPGLNIGCNECGDSFTEASS